MAKGFVVVNEDMCKGCQLCVSVCPFHLLLLAEHYNERGYRPAMLVDPDSRCTGCAACATICPDAVIIVFRKEKAEHVERPDSMREAA